MKDRLKIYTKTGDKGETGLIGGRRVSKGAARIEAYGHVDELNAILGIAASLLDVGSADVAGVLLQVQAELFVAGADLAAPPDNKSKTPIPRVEERHVDAMEKLIDKYDDKLPPLQNFILPSGTVAGSWLHFARAACRRAEREVVRLSAKEEVNGLVIRYLNRLSDFLFVLARTVNARGKAPEIAWRPDSGSLPQG